MEISSGASSLSAADTARPLEGFRFRLLPVSSLYVNSVYLIIANAANAALGFAFWIIAARLYRPQDVGLAAAAISASMLLVVVSDLGFTEAIVRFLPGSLEPKTVLSSSVCVGGAAALLACGAFLAGLGLWLPSLLPLRSSALFVAGFTLVTVCLTVSGMAAGAFVAEGRAGYMLTQTGLFGAIKAAAALGAAAIGSAAVLVGAWAVGALVVVVFSVWFLLPRLRSGAMRVHLGVDLRMVREMAGFALANYAAVGLGAAPAFLLPLLIVSLRGPEAAAHFYVAFNISSSVAMIPTMVALALFAHGSAGTGSPASLVAGSLRLALALTFPALIAAWAIGDKLLLLFGRGYSVAATHTLWVLVFAIVPLTVNVLFFAVRKVQKQLRDVVVGSAWILAVTLGVGALLLPRIGLVGAGIAWLAAHGSLAAAVLVVYARHWRNILLPAHA